LALVALSVIEQRYRAVLAASAPGETWATRAWRVVRLVSESGLVCAERVREQQGGRSGTVGRNPSAAHRLGPVAARDPPADGAAPRHDPRGQQQRSADLSPGAGGVEARSVSRTRFVGVASVGDMPRQPQHSTGAASEASVRTRHYRTPEARRLDGPLGGYPARVDIYGPLGGYPARVDIFRLGGMPGEP
jgi:hypothetical protein